VHIVFQFCQPDLLYAKLETRLVTEQNTSMRSTVLLTFFRENPYIYRLCVNHFFAFDNDGSVSCKCDSSLTYFLVSALFENWLHGELEARVNVEA